MPKPRIIGLIVMVWFLTLSTAHAVGLEVALGAWQQDPGGDISYKAQSPNGILDVDNDLKYDTENRVHARAKIDMPAFVPNIYLMAAPSEFEGNGLKDVNFNFGDLNIGQSVPFYSKLTYNQYDVGLYYGLPFLQTATLNKLNVDIGINARIVDLKAYIRENTAGQQDSQSVTFAVPQVYVGVQFTPVKWLAIEAEGRGMSISGNSMYSLIGRVRFKVFGPVFVAAGYRHDKIDVDESDVKVNFTIQGPFAEVGLKF